MAELQAKEYKSDLQRVTDELNDLKKKYIAEKKAQKFQKLAYESSREVNQYNNKQNGAQVKYTGGGFRMSVQSITSFNWVYRSWTNKSNSSRSPGVCFK